MDSAAADLKYQLWVTAVQERLTWRLSFDPFWQLARTLMAVGGAEYIAVIERLPRTNERDYWYALLALDGDRAFAVTLDTPDGRKWTGNAARPPAGPLRSADEARRFFRFVDRPDVWEQREVTFWGLEGNYLAGRTYEAHPWAVHLYRRDGQKVVRFMMETPFNEYIDQAVVNATAPLAAVPRDPPESVERHWRPLPPGGIWSTPDDRPVSPYPDKSTVEALRDRYRRAHPARQILTGVLRVLAQAGKT